MTGDANGGAFTELEALSGFLERVGYARDHQATAFPVWIDGHEVTRLDLAAFGRSSPHDMTTATVVCERTIDPRPSPRIRRAAEVLAAPVVLTAFADKVAIWPSQILESPVAIEDLRGTPRTNLVQLLRPDELLSAKIGARQLPLFPTPVNLLTSARSDRAAQLEPLLVAALETAAGYYKSLNDDLEGAHRRAARLVVGALTTLVLRDKTDLRELTQDELLNEVTRRFARNFEWLDGMRSSERKLLSSVLTELGEWIDYTSLDPSTLSQVYEGALVADEERAELGIHYTPPDLARRLISDLPVEIIPPTERHVVDPACGSGTLLVAAHDRLRGLQPPGWTDARRHEDLRVHLRGIDRDPVAAEIARLALLLNAMPVGNGWHVENRDSLVRGHSAWGRPSIVVANPPWKHTRRGEVLELADRFVAAAVEMVTPGGLLAFLLPQSWLDSSASKDTREHLRSSCETFEFWRLPADTFPTSRARSVALMARKRESPAREDGARLLRFVRPGGLSRFTQVGCTDETYVLPPDRRAHRQLLPGPLTYAFEGAEADVGGFADVLTGPQPRPGIHDGTGQVPYLDSFRDIEAYERIDASGAWRVRFPEDFQQSRGQALISRAKILVSALRMSDGPWCVKSALDLSGVAVRNSVHMVAPHDASDDSLYALFAYSCSGLFNCWIDEHAVGVNIPTRATRSAPLPFGDRFASTLAELGREIERAARQRDQRFHAVLQRLEGVIWQGFPEDHPAKEICLRRLAGQRAPEGQLRYEEWRPQALRSERPVRRRFGYVMAVTPTRVRIWVNGLTEDGGVLIGVPPRMPGWLLREGATFDVTDYGGGLETGRFTPQATSYEEFALSAS